MAADLFLSRTVAMLPHTVLEDVLQMRRSACSSRPLSLC